MNANDSSTNIVLRDIIDNSTWEWIKLQPDTTWVDAATGSWVNKLINEW